LENNEITKRMSGRTSSFVLTRPDQLAEENQIPYKIIVISIFMDKKVIPTDDELLRSLEGTFYFWQNFMDYVQDNYTKCKDEWNYSGDK
jgi:hypothetical protein